MKLDLTDTELEELVIKIIEKQLKQIGLLRFVRNCVHQYINSKYKFEIRIKKKSDERRKKK